MFLHNQSVKEHSLFLYTDTNIAVFAAIAAWRVIDSVLAKHGIIWTRESQSWIL